MAVLRLASDIVTVVTEATLTLTLTLTLILLHQPETTAIFGSIISLCLCHSNYDLSTPTAARTKPYVINRKSRFNRA